MKVEVCVRDRVQQPKQLCREPSTMLLYETHLTFVW